MSWDIYVYFILDRLRLFILLFIGYQNEHQPLERKKQTFDNSFGDIK